MVADHQQGRVIEVFSVVIELKIGGAKILVLALVLPCEVVPLPYIGKALAAFEGGDVPLKGEGVSGLVSGGGTRTDQ